MKNAVIILCILLFVIRGRAETVIHIREKSMETGNPQLLLREILPDTGQDATGLDDYLDFALCRSPIPGDSRTVYVSHINNLLKAESVPVRLEAPFSEFKLKRTAGKVPYERFEKTVRECLLEKYPDDRIEVSFRERSLSTPADLASIELRSEPDLGRQMLTFLLRDSSGGESSVRTYARIGLRRKCPVAVRDIRYGEIVGEGDWEIREVLVDSSRSLSVQGQFDPSGMMISHSVSEGSVLRKSWFKTPELVRRGDRVMIVKTLGRLDIIDRAEVLESGSYGDVISVRNIKSRKVISARVESGSRVSAL